MMRRRGKEKGRRKERKEWREKGKGEGEREKGVPASYTQNTTEPTQGAVSGTPL